jgi:electron transfer flavoprotein alpha subunit
VHHIFLILDDLTDGAAELAAAAQSFGEVQTTAAIFGGSEETHQSVAALFDKLLCFPPSANDCFDAEYMQACVLPIIQEQQPDLVLLHHSNNGLDLAPLLAAKADRPMLADCLSLEAREQGLGAIRTVYGGKVHARIAAEESANGYLATIRPGAFAAAASQNEASANQRAGVIESASAPADYQARRHCKATLTPDAGAVDITQSETLVAVGRGIEEEENLEVVEALADALGAELACTRPIVDNKWMEKSRQIGTSGLTVKPKVYITVGVSGSFQHLGGVKGAPFMVAINQDPAAPIFATADVGLVGDLFDLVPLLEEKVRERKG